MIVRCVLLAASVWAVAPATGASGQEPAQAVGDSVSARYVDADLRAVVQSLARYLSKPVVIGSVPSLRITLETPQPVPRSEVLPLLRALLETHNLEIVEEAAFFRVRGVAVAPAAPAPAPAAPAPIARARQEPRLFVIRLRHARAADVAATINQLYGGSGVGGGASGLSRGTLSDELRRNQIPQQGQAPPPQSARPATLSGEVTIVPDEMTNALLVRSTEEDLSLLREVVEALDIRPLQVLIEVLIIEARRDRGFSLGADLFMPQRPVGDNATAGGSVTGGGLGDLVIRLLDMGKGNVDATIRAAESRGDVEIVSRPVLLVSNNTEARFLVGSQRPFVQVSRSLPTDAPSRDQVIQYRDVGTRLVVRPTINHDGYVSLEIQQEVNAATSETQFDAPVISTREAFTRVLARDSQTIVLGGLRDHQQDTRQGGIPLLSRIPLIGGLFGSSSSRDSATELFLFVTPRILRTDADADSVTSRRLPAGGVP